ncbi:hypothetical protein GCM10010402_38550 [Actinomadura luteofluorescens]|uniref:DUF2637 domain-containing protein n=1 Tax=Actinomadura luteofluorescens TaxID=46163 RepID=UPI00216457E9|nr:DUF2637 domain-containing protein [Actinomadura glauciflava]MCR3740265.1 Protein of unknown function (DUF2637) [Actinomadura glauciflava]
MTDRLIKVTTALAVVAVAAVAALISYAHMLDLVRTHGETGVTAQLVPFTVDGLILAASMVILDASRRDRPVPALARWSLAAGICATVGANVAHGAAHGPIGALVSAWPALALVGSFELLMALTRMPVPPPGTALDAQRIRLEQPNSDGTSLAQTPEQTILAEYRSSLDGPGRPVSQRYLAEKYGIDRRKVKQIITGVQDPAPS